MGSLFQGLVGMASPLLKKGDMGKSLGQKALKAGVQLTQDYVGDKRNSNQKSQSFKLVLKKADEENMDQIQQSVITPLNLELLRLT